MKDWMKKFFLKFENCRKCAVKDETLQEEIDHHDLLCDQNSRRFCGREKEVEQIIEYLRKDVENGEFVSPLVVYGESRCGKTSVIAKAASLAKDEFPDRIQVTRFLGTTTESSTISKLLHSICCQIQRATDLTTSKDYESYEEIQQQFLAVVKKLKDYKTYNCILFLDSINQLKSGDGSHTLDWLPTDLPPCFRVVVTTTPSYIRKLKRFSIFLPLITLVPGPSAGEIRKVSSGYCSEIELPLMPSCEKKMKYLQNLKENVLFNFKFLFSKLHAFGFDSVMKELEEARKMYPQDADINTLYMFMKASSRTLRIDEDQLSTQLHGRLLGSSHSRFIQKLLEDANRPHIPCFLPNKRCFDEPSGSLKHSLNGHEENVEHASFTQDGKKLFSVGTDATLRIWDMENGSEIRCLTLQKPAKGVFAYNNDTCAILVGYDTVTAINIQTEEVYYTGYHTSSYGPSSDISPDRMHFVFIAREGIIVFNMSKDKPEKIQRMYREQSQSTVKGFRDLVITSNKHYAFTRGDNIRFFIRKFDDLDHNMAVKSPNPLITLAFARQGSHIVAVASLNPLTFTFKRPVMYIFDAESGGVLKKIIGIDSHAAITCMHSCICQTRNGLELIWATLSQINFWNLDTGEERIALKQCYQGRQYKSAFSHDGESLVVVTMDTNNTPIQVYDMNELDLTVVDDSFAERSFIDKTKEYLGTGDKEIYFSRSDPNLCISVTPADSILKIWDIQKRTQTKECKIEDLYPNSLRTIDDCRALIWEKNKQGIYLVNFMTEEILFQLKFEDKVEITPSADTNCWVDIQAKDELVVFSEATADLLIIDLKTGRKSGEIKTDWSAKGQHMLASKDGSIILSKEVDPNNHFTVSPLCVFDIIQRKKVGEMKRDAGFDLRPHIASLSEDGKYFVTSSGDHSMIEIWDAQDQQQINSLQPCNHEGEFVYVQSLTVTSQGGFILASVQTKDADGSYERIMYVIDLFTLEFITKFPTYGNPFCFQFSDNCNVLLTESNPEKGFVKCLDLYDISKVKSDGIIKKIASLKPETDTRFAYLSQDGKTVCVGLAGVDGIIFFSACGEVK